MSTKRFVDTNILVHAYDTIDPRKQNIAQNLIMEGIQAENFVLSVQVLGEFFNVVTRYIENPMTPVEAQKAISKFSLLPVQEIDLGMVHRAIDTQKKYRLSYRHSLIIAAPERSKCSTILSEDMSHGQIYQGIEVSNPF